jgi:hypothetical protein
MEVGGLISVLQESEEKMSGEIEKLKHDHEAEASRVMSEVCLYPSILDE